MATKNAKDTTYSGNRRVLSFTLTESDGSPLNLTGYTVKWALSKYGGSGQPSKTPILELKSTDNTQVNITNAAGGLVQVIIPEGATAALEGAFYYELEVFDASLHSCVVAYGDLQINRNLTNT